VRRVTRQSCFTPVADMATVTPIACKVGRGIPGVATEYVSLRYEMPERHNQQTQPLTQLRDTLVPRLISGQLRLPEAETLAKEVLA